MKVDLKNPEKLKKYAFIGVVGIVGIVGLYFVFAPSKEEAMQGSEIMTELPDPHTQPLESDKSKAYEAMEAERILMEQMQSLEDIELSTTNQDSEVPVITSDVLREQDERRRTINEANRVLESANNIDKEPESTEDPELIEMKQKLIEAETKQKQLEAEMAASLAQLSLSNNEAREIPSEKEPESSNQELCAPVTKVPGGMMATTLRRQGFNGIDPKRDNQKNTIAAMTYGRQIISDGQYVKFRLVEPMQIGSTILPKGSIVVGTANISTDRLYVRITNIEFNEIIASVSLEIYDIDGQRGLFIPGSMEMDAARDIGASVANSLASSATSNVSITASAPSASEQLKTEVGRGVIQGTASYVGRKLQQIKVTIQDYHKVYLVPTSQIK